MKGTHATEQKRMRIKRLLAIVTQVKEIEMRHLLSISSINFGLSHQKTKEYLEDLELQGSISIEGDMVKSVEVKND